MSGQVAIPPFLLEPDRCAGGSCRRPVIWPGLLCGRCANRARRSGAATPANPADAPWAGDPAAGPLTLDDDDLLLGKRRNKNDIWVRCRDVSQARLPGLDDEAVNRLARNGSFGVRRAVARRPDLTVETIRFLALDYEDSVQRDLTSNPHLDLAELWRQARHGGWNAQVGIAANPAAPPTLLWWLAAWPAAVDIPTPTWAHLAVNPNTPADLIGRLARCGTLQAVSAPTCPPDVLAGAALHSNPAIRARAARHPGTPAAALAVLAADPDETIRQAALANASCPLAGRAAAGLLAD